MQAGYVARRFGIFLLIVWLAATLNFFLPRALLPQGMANHPQFAMDALFGDLADALRYQQQIAGAPTNDLVEPIHQARGGRRALARGSIQLLNEMIQVVALSHRQCGSRGVQSPA